MNEDYATLRGDRVALVEQGNRRIKAEVLKRHGYVIGERMNGDRGYQIKSLRRRIKTPDLNEEMRRLPPMQRAWDVHDSGISEWITEWF